MKKFIKLGLFLLVFTFAISTCLAKPLEDVNTISTTGTAQINALPDMAYVSLGVVSKGKTVEFVRADNAQVMQNIANILAKYGIAKENIKTTGFNLQPVYVKDDNKIERIVGYSLENTLSVKLSDVNLIGKIIDDCFAGGVNRLNGVSFALRDAQKVQDKLLATALADGKNKATIVANAAGRNIGKLLKAEVSVPNFSGGENRSYAKAFMADGVSSQVFAGSLVYFASINLTYELL